MENIPTMNDKIVRFLFATNLCKEMHGLIHLADTKAHIALVIQTTLIVVVMDSKMVGERIGAHETSVLFLLCFISFLVIAILGLVLAASVFIPRKSISRHNESLPGVMFYEEIKAFNGSGPYYQAFKGMTEEQLIEELMTENYNLSLIVQKKMTYVRQCLRVLFATIVLCILVFFLAIHA